MLSSLLCVIENTSSNQLWRFNNLKKRQIEKKILESQAFWNLRYSLVPILQQFSYRIIEIHFVWKANAEKYQKLPDSGNIYRNRHMNLARHTDIKSAKPLMIWVKNRLQYRFDQWRHSVLRVVSVLTVCVWYFWRHLGGVALSFWCYSIFARLVLFDLYLTLLSLLKVTCSVALRWLGIG